MRLKLTPIQYIACKDNLSPFRASLLSTIGETLAKEWLISFQKPENQEIVMII